MGFSTVEQLILKNKRAVLQLPVLRKTEKDKINIVLKNDEELILFLMAIMYVVQNFWMTAGTYR